MGNLKVLELYSGIGGMHFALKESGVAAEVVMAADINTVANLVYKHNFPLTNLFHKNISSLSVSMIEDLEIDMILMSPPCQPYTRIGKKGDTLDRRSDSLMHLTEIIPQLTKLQCLLLENVRGFEISDARLKVINSLKPGFHILEFMLNPVQFGIPNSRERYYLLARRKPFNTTPSSGNLITEPSLLRASTNSMQISKILEFSDESEEYENYLIPMNIVLRRVSIMDIITKHSFRSCCFTKAYGRFIERTGSVYTSLTEDKLKQCIESIKDKNYIENNELFDTMRLRFFTPKEISRLMCFPLEFKFSNSVTIRQKYNLLGNSINVQVVSDLIRFLINVDS